MCLVRDLIVTGGRMVSESDSSLVESSEEVDGSRGRLSGC